MFALLMKLYGTILLSIFLQPHRTVVAIFVQSNFGLFWWNPGNHARNPVAAETRLKNTAVHHYCTTLFICWINMFLWKFQSLQSHWWIWTVVYVVYRPFETKFIC